MRQQGPRHLQKVQGNNGVKAGRVIGGRFEAPNGRLPVCSPKTYPADVVLGRLIGEVGFLFVEVHMSQG